MLLEDTEGPAKTIVLITDGKPTDQPDALEAAAAARKRGIKMVVVGAGDIDYGGWASWWYGGRGEGGLEPPAQQGTANGVG